jgi:hypothetical protein
VPKNKTENNTFLLTDLLACQSYLIAIGIVGPIGPGPLGKNPRSVETLYSERKPPKNLHAEVDELNYKMYITWEHSCPLRANNRYPDYVVSLLLTKTHIYRDKVWNYLRAGFFLISNSKISCLQKNYHGRIYSLVHKLFMTTNISVGFPLHFSKSMFF